MVALLPPGTLAERPRKLLNAILAGLGSGVGVSPAQYGATPGGGDSYAAIIAAQAAAITAGVPLIIDAPYSIASSITFTVPVTFLPTGQLAELNTSCAVIFSSSVEAGRQHILDFSEVPESTAAARVTFAAGQTVFPEWFGALAAGPPDGGYDDSAAWQQAADSIRVGGGLVRGAPGKSYPIRYPLVAMGSGVIIDAEGCELLSDMARSGRASAPLVNIGNSREWNIATIKSRRLAGDLSGAFTNASFSDVTLGSYPDASDAGINTRRCKLKGGRLSFYDDVSQPGNYGVQFSNAFACSAKDYTCRNTGQAFGFGSDVAPNNPYALMCWVADVTVEQTNQYHTYYAAGFHGYARRCRDRNVRVLVGCVDGSTDGNLWSSNYAVDCISIDSGGDCGRGANGEGFLFGENAARCIVENPYVRRSRRAYCCNNDLGITEANSNSFRNAFAEDVDYLMSSISKRCGYISVRGRGVVTAEIRLGNVNATDNLYVDCDANRLEWPAGSWSQSEAIWRQRFVGARSAPTTQWSVVHPSPFIDDRSDIAEITTNNLKLKAKTGTSTFRISVSALGFNLITGYRFNGTFDAGSRTAGSKATITLYRRNPSAVDSGNISSAPTVIDTFTAGPPATDAVTDFTRYVNNNIFADVMRDGSDSDLFFEIVWTNPTMNSNQKLLGIQGRR